MVPCTRFIKKDVPTRLDAVVGLETTLATLEGRELSLTYSGSLSPHQYQYVLAPQSVRLCPPTRRLTLRNPVGITTDCCWPSQASVMSQSSDNQILGPNDSGWKGWCRSGLLPEVLLLVKADQRGCFGGVVRRPDSTSACTIRIDLAVSITVQRRAQDRYGQGTWPCSACWAPSARLGQPASFGRPG